MRNRPRGCITDDGFDGVACELGAKSVVGEAREIGAEIFFFAPVGEIGAQQALDRVGNSSARAAIADGASDGWFWPTAPPRQK